MHVGQPSVVHSREAYKDLDLLPPSCARGNVCHHCFAANEDVRFLGSSSLELIHSWSLQEELDLLMNPFFSVLFLAALSRTVSG